VHRSKYHRAEPPVDDGDDGDAGRLLSGGPLKCCLNHDAYVVEIGHAG
jgi:hypothetical protein